MPDTLPARRVRDVLYGFGRNRQQAGDYLRPPCAGCFRKPGRTLPDLLAAARRC
jgi:hypothetical protein